MKYYTATKKNKEAFCIYFHGKMSNIISEKQVGKPTENITLICKIKSKICSNHVLAQPLLLLQKSPRKFNALEKWEREAKYHLLLAGALASNLNSSE